MGTRESAPGAVERRAPRRARFTALRHARPGQRPAPDARERNPLLADPHAVAHPERLVDPHDARLASPRRLRAIPRYGRALEQSAVREKLDRSELDELVSRIRARQGQVLRDRIAAIRLA
jgi:hypothetical protein